MSRPAKPRAPVGLPSISTIQLVGNDIALYKPLTPEHARFHQSQAMVRWLFGGNQSGKTYTNMMDLCMIALDVHPFRKPIPNGIHWVAIESWEQVRDSLWNDYISKFIPQCNIRHIMYGQDRIPKRIELKNNHVIEFKAFNQGRTLFQSRRINTFHGDEQCLSNFEGILSEIIIRLLVKNGFMSWSLSPIDTQPELESRIEDLPDTDETFIVDMEDNRKSKGGYIDDNTMDKTISSMSDEVKACRVHGRFSKYFGLVYKEFSKSINVVQPFDIPDDWVRYRGVDFGFTNPFCCLWVARSPDDDFYVYREYYKAQTSIMTHIEVVNERSDGENFQGTFADPENAEDRSVMRKHGIPTFTAKKDVQRGIEKMQEKLKVKENGKPSLLVFSTCRNLISEFLSYSYPKGTKARNASDLPTPKKDHAVSALRYVIYSLCHGKKKGRVIYDGE